MINKKAKNRKIVLILTTVGPNPSTGSRPEKLAYRSSKLIENGYQPVIMSHAFSYKTNLVSLNEGKVPYYGPRIRPDYSRPSDETLVGAGDERGLLKRALTAFTNVADRLSPIDPILKFVPTTYYRVNKILKEKDVSALITQTYPFSTNLIGYLISRKYNIPWIMEYRDPWLNNPSAFPDGPNFTNIYLESKSIGECDLLVYYDGIQIPKGYFKKSHPEHQSKILDLGYMGFDERTISKISPKKFNKLTLTYTGSLHNDAYNIDPLLKGLKEFVNAQDVSSELFQVNFLGDKPDLGEQYKELKKYIESPGWVQPEEAYSFIKGSDYAVYLNANRPGDEHSISQKMWDYIGCRTPVLCLSRPGWESWNFVSNNNVGICVDYHDTNEIAKGLHRLQNEEPPRISKEFSNHFERSQSEEAFIEALNSIVCSS